jgi:hypothetical protein
MGLLSKAAVKQNTGFSAGAGDEARSVIENFQKSVSSFHCIVLENAGTSTAAMLARAGAVCALPSGNCLVLVPGAADRELLAHRLSKSLNAAVLCQCGAASAEEAYSALDSWL